MKYSQLIMIISVAIYIFSMIPPIKRILLNHFSLKASNDYKPWEIYRLFTYVFVHFEFSHLLFNMLGIYFFAEVLEKKYIKGPAFLCFFFLSVFLASVLRLVILKTEERYSAVIGISGFVYSCVFALGILNPKIDILLFYAFRIPIQTFMALFTIYSLVSLVFSNSSTDHRIHIFGGLAGITVSYLITTRIIYQFLPSI